MDGEFLVLLVLWIYEILLPPKLKQILYWIASFKGRFWDSTEFQV